MRLPHASPAIFPVIYSNWFEEVMSHSLQLLYQRIYQLCKEIMTFYPNPPATVEKY